MFKIFFLIFPLLCFGEVTSNDIFLCDKSDYSKCEEIGLKFMSSSGSDYNPDRSQYPLKKACLYGKLSDSCVSLSKFYFLKNDSVASKRYLKMACDLGDVGSCYYFNHMRLK